MDKLQTKCVYLLMAERINPLPTTVDRAQRERVRARKRHEKTIITVDVSTSRLEFDPNGDGITRDAIIVERPRRARRYHIITHDHMNDDLRS
jgi:hypothetical protein